MIGEGGIGKLPTNLLFVQKIPPKKKLCPPAPICLEYILHRHRHCSSDVDHQSETKYYSHTRHMFYVTTMCRPTSISHNRCRPNS